MPHTLRALIVESQPADAERLLHELRQAGFVPDWRRVETEAEFVAGLQPEPDLILTDYHLPRFDALRALEVLHERQLDVPLLIVTDSRGENLALAALRHG